MGKRFLYAFAGLVVAYVAIVMLTPTDPNVLARYDLSQASARLLNLTVIVPLVVIWAAAFYGFSRIKNYAESLQGSTDAKPFHTLSDGLMVLVMSFPLTSATSAALSYLAVKNPDLVPTVTITRNYLNVAFALVAFYLIGKGAEALARPVKKKAAAFDHQIWTISFIVLSSLFAWLVVSHHTGADAGSVVYHLPDWLLVLSLVIPYLYVWYRGMVAVYCLGYYQKKVRGILYKQALQYVSAGIAVVVATSIFIQFLTVFGERLNRLDLTPVLLLVYLLVVFYALGYGLIAKGARRLKKIEDA